MAMARNRTQIETLDVLSSWVVAEQILWLRRERESTPMHVIKLAYLCHGWMLGIHRRGLINESVEAWRYGPVVPSVYHTYKAFGGEPITTAPRDQGDLLDNDQKALIEEVAQAYRDYTAWALSSITHQPGTPWHIVYRGGRGEGAVIPNEVIRDHYERRAHGS